MIFLPYEIGVFGTPIWTALALCVGPWLLCVSVARRQGHRSFWYGVLGGLLGVGGLVFTVVATKERTQPDGQIELLRMVERSERRAQAVEAWAEMRCMELRRRNALWLLGVYLLAKIAFALALVTFLLIYICPSLASLWEGMNLVLPVPLRWSLAAYHLLHGGFSGPTLALLASMVPALALALARSPNDRRLLWAGTMRRQMDDAAFYSALRTALTAGGASVGEMVEAALQACGPHRSRRLLGRLAPGDWESLSDVLERMMKGTSLAPYAVLLGNGESNLETLRAVLSGAASEAMEAAISPGILRACGAAIYFLTVWGLAGVFYFWMAWFLVDSQCLMGTLQ